MQGCIKRLQDLFWVGLSSQNVCTWMYIYKTTVRSFLDGHLHSRALWCSITNLRRWFGRRRSSRYTSNVAGWYQHGRPSGVYYMCTMTSVMWHCCCSNIYLSLLIIRLCVIQTNGSEKWASSKKTEGISVWKHTDRMLGTQRKNERQGTRLHAWCRPLIIKHHCNMRLAQID